MPTYEFRCPEGHEFEKFYRSIAAAPREVHCPTCGKLAERQLSAGGGLHFKGSGFYITDYKRAGEKRESEGDGKPVTESKPASEVKPASDSKPVESAKKKKDSGEK